MGAPVVSHRVLDECARLAVEGGWSTGRRQGATNRSVEAWAASLGDLEGSVLVDTDGLLTVRLLLQDSQADGALALTPFNLWELSAFADQVVCYDHLWHFADDGIDDAMINDWLGDDVLRTIPETVDGTCDAVFQDGFHEARDILARYRAPSDDLEREEQRAVLRAWSTMTGQKVRPGDAFLESESDNSGSRSDDTRMTASHRPAPVRRSNIPAQNQTSEQGWPHPCAGRNCSPEHSP